MFCKQKKNVCIFIFSTVNFSVRSSPPPPSPGLLCPVFFSQWESTMRQRRPQSDGLLCVWGVYFSLCFKSLPKPPQRPPDAAAFWLLCEVNWLTDRAESTQASCPGARASSGILGVTGWLAVPSLKRSSTWLSPRGRPSQPLQARHQPLKRDPPLTQLSDCRPSIIIMLFFFAFREEAPFLKAGNSGSSATLHVWELKRFLSSLPVPAGTTLVSEPLLWSWEDRQQGSVC